MPVFWICAVATRIAQNVQKKAGRLASNMGTINIYHIVLKSKLNALISWEMTKKSADLYRKCYYLCQVIEYQEGLEITKKEAKEYLGMEFET